jgi:hypothetical protein
MAGFIHFYPTDPISPRTLDMWTHHTVHNQRGSHHKLCSRPLTVSAPPHSTPIQNMVIVLHSYTDLHKLQKTDTGPTPSQHPLRASRRPLPPHPKLRTPNTHQHPTRPMPHTFITQLSSYLPNFRPWPRHFEGRHMSHHSPHTVAR